MKIGNDWDEKLALIENSIGFEKFMHLIKQKYQTNTCYPSYENIFKAFKLTPYKDVKAVIIGQDPYHAPNQAMGLSFSVPGEKFQPSLHSIYKELEDDLGIPPSKTGDLTKWADEGILLLNAILTVEAGKALSHAKLGWEKFTDYVIKILNLREEPVVFILWGNFARSKKALITNSQHLIIESAHPSPYSAHYGFFGSKPFSKTNDFLVKNNYQPINWQL